MTTMRWWVVKTGESQASGPFSRQACSELVRDGQLTAESLVAREHANSWNAARSDAELASLFTRSSSPPRLPSVGADVPPAASTAAGGMGGSVLTVSEMMADGWSAFKRSAGVLIGQYLLVMFALNVVYVVPSAFLGAMSDRLDETEAVIVMLAAMVPQTLFGMFIAALYLQMGLLANRGRVAFGQLFASISRVPRAVVGMVAWFMLMLAIYMVFLVMVGLCGLVLFEMLYPVDAAVAIAIISIIILVPLTIFLLPIQTALMNTAFAGMDPLSASASILSNIGLGWRYARAARWRLVRLYLLLGLLAAIGTVLTCGIGGLIVIPVFVCVLGAAYESLRQSESWDAPSYETGEPEQPQSARPAKGAGPDVTMVID